MPASDPSPGDVPAPRAALVALATALDPREFATSLTAPPGRPPRLNVTSRHAAIGDDITADHRAYYLLVGGMDRADQRPGHRRPHDHQRAAHHAQPTRG